MRQLLPLLIFILLTACTEEAQTPSAGLGQLLAQAQPGDTVIMPPGTYIESIEWTGVGTPDAPITIQAEGVEMFGQGGQPFALWCVACEYVTITGLTVRNYTDFGIGFTESVGIRIEDVTLEANGHAPYLRGWGMEGYGIHVEHTTDFAITGSTVTNNGPHPKTRRHPMGTGINLYDCTDCVVRDNLNARNTGGVLVEDSINVVVQGNTITDNDLDASRWDWWDGGVWVDGGRDVVVRDNVIRNNAGPGIQVSDEDRQSPTGFVVTGNTIEGNYYGVYVWNFTDDGLPPEDVLRFDNNVIDENTRQAWWVQGIICPTPC